MPKKYYGTKDTGFVCCLRILLSLSFAFFIILFFSPESPFSFQKAYAQYERREMSPPRQSTPPPVSQPPAQPVQYSSPPVSQPPAHQRPAYQPPASPQPPVQPTSGGTIERPASSTYRPIAQDPIGQSIHRNAGGDTYVLPNQNVPRARGRTAVTHPNLAPEQQTQVEASGRVWNPNDPKKREGTWYDLGINLGRAVGDTLGISSETRETVQGLYDHATTTGRELLESALPQSVIDTLVAGRHLVDLRVNEGSQLTLDVIPTPDPNREHTIGIALNPQGNLVPYQVVDRLTSGEWQQTTGYAGRVVQFGNEAFVPDLLDMGTFREISPNSFTIERIDENGRLNWSVDFSKINGPGGMEALMGKSIINPVDVQFFRDSYAYLPSNITPFVENNGSFAMPHLDRYDMAVGTSGWGSTFKFAEGKPFSGDLYAGIGTNPYGAGDPFSNNMNMDVYWNFNTPGTVPSGMETMTPNPDNPFNFTSPSFDNTVNFGKATTYSFDNPNPIYETSWQFSGMGNMTGMENLTNYGNMAAYPAYGSSPSFQEPFYEYGMGNLETRYSMDFYSYPSTYNYSPVGTFYPYNTESLANRYGDINFNVSATGFENRYGDMGTQFPDGIYANLYSTAPALNPWSPFTADSSNFLPQSITENLNRLIDNPSNPLAGLQEIGNAFQVRSSVSLNTNLAAFDRFGAGTFDKLANSDFTAKLVGLEAFNNSFDGLRKLNSETKINTDLVWVERINPLAKETEIASQNFADFIKDSLRKEFLRDNNGDLKERGTVRTTEEKSLPTRQEYIPIDEKIAQTENKKPNPEHQI